MSSSEQTRLLYELLRDLFASEAQPDLALRRFLRAGPDGARTNFELPGSVSPAVDIACEAVDMLFRAGGPDSEWFDRLRADRPRKTWPQIERVAQQLGISLNSRKSPNPFRHPRPYDPEFDVRDPSSMSFEQPSSPHGQLLWPVVAPRHGGRTWFLSAMAWRLNQGERPKARLVDLDRVTLPPEELSEECVLLDNPRLTGPGARDMHKFVAWCEQLVARGRFAVVALTPVEWDHLRRCGGCASRLPEQPEVIPSLTDAEAAKLASRAAAAETLLRELPWQWRRNAFLLELIFWLQARSRGETAAGLIRHAWRYCEESGYVRDVFLDSLTAEQQEKLRKTARGDATKAPVLQACGLIEERSGVQRISDPMLAAAFDLVKIHHISDLHVDARVADGETSPRRLYRRELQRLRDLGQAPHILVVAGDLVQHADPESFTAARAWLESLRPLLEPHAGLAGDEPTILVVGGGHDVDWGLPDTPARHVALADALKGSDDRPAIPHPGIDQEPTNRRPRVCLYPGLDVEVLLLGSSELSATYVSSPRIRQVLRMIDEFRETLRTTGGEDGGEDGGVDVDPGFVHPDTLAYVSGAFDRDRDPERGTFKLAALHHPISPLRWAHGARFGGVLNAGDVKDTLLAAGVSLVLHGHGHQGWIGEERWPERYPERKLRLLAASSLAQFEAETRQGFNVIEICRELYLDRGPRRRFAVTVGIQMRDFTAWKCCFEESFVVAAPPPEQ